MSEEQGRGAGKKPVFLNAKQIAERYGVSRQWAYHSPDIAHLRHKIGKYVLWKLEDLEAFEAEQKERSQILAKYREWEIEKKRKKLIFDME